MPKQEKPKEKPDFTPVILVPIVSIEDLVKERDRDEALPIEQKTRGRKMLFKGERR